MTYRLATHADDFLPCAAVALGIECARSHRYPDPVFPWRMRVTTRTYGELVYPRPDIWQHESAGTMVGGYWGPHRIFANVPLSAIDAYPTPLPEEN